MQAQQDPVFVKINEVKPRQHCKNVYVKIISVEVTEQPDRKNENESFHIASGYCADETGFLPFRVPGQYASVLKKDAVVAFRNLKSEIFAGQHRLSVDKWGKITEEKNVEIKQAQTEYKRTTVENLQPGENGDHVAVRIKEVTHTDDKFPIAEGLCGDQTAMIKFKVVGQSAKECQKDRVVLFINSKSEVFEEIHRIGSGKRGKVIAVDDNIKINEAKNMSDVRYERVVVDGADDAQDRQRNNRRENRGDRDNNRRGDRDNRDNRRQGDNRDRRGNNDNRRGDRDNNRREGGDRRRN